MGERFGNYEIIRRLATGGMAEVLLAKQHGMGGFERLVCLKRILPHLSRQEDFLKMFQDEARIAANLMHPNIAQIYDIAQEGDDFYISMEYVRGEDLRRVYNQEVSRGQTIPPNIAAHVAMGAAAGLDYAHRQTTLDGQPLGLVHRDISPQNIVVAYDGHVKLIDFGVAKAAGKLIQTRSGVLKGKYSYMSPEQASGDPLDGRTDVFALGVTLYEITTGTRLFKRENELETLHAVIACNVTPPSQVVPHYDSALEAIIMKALAYDADDRFFNAGEMEHALEEYLLQSGHPTSASNLATYMHELFAAKMADEALFGGPPWNEPETSSRLIANKKERRQGEASVPQENTLIDTAIDEPSRSSHSVTDADWDLEVVAEENTGKLYVPAMHVAQGAAKTERTLTKLQAPDPIVGAQTGAQTGFTPIPAATPGPTRSRGGRAMVAVLVVTLLAGGGWWWMRRRTAPQVPEDEVIKAVPGDPKAYLTVAAPGPMAVTVGARFIGDTPLSRMPMEPGSYRLKLESKNDGLVIRRNVKLVAGTQALVKVSDAKGYLTITGKPWAWVQLGMQPAQETPLRLELYEGEYTVVFECPDGHRKSVPVQVTANGTEDMAMNCDAE